MEELAKFIFDALESAGGEHHPDDELFRSMSVKSITFGSVTISNPDPKRF